MIERFNVLPAHFGRVPPCSGLLALLILLLGPGCGPGATPSPPSVPTAQDTGATSIRYADGFRIEQGPGYRIVDVLQPWRDAEASFRYLLVPRGSDAPEGFPEARVVELPVRTVVVLSTTHVGPIDELGLADRIVGVSGGDWITSETVRNGLDEKTVIELGLPGGLDYERIAVLAPDLVMALGTGPADMPRFEKIAELGIPVVFNGEYAEHSPLGRAEWIKFVAAFFDAGPEADARFGEIEAHYTTLAARAGAAGDRPTVFTGTNWQGTWFAPGGESYMARFIRDAGASYLWADTPSDGVLPLDFETVLDRAIEADFWLNTASWRSLADATAEDPRYEVFEAWQRGDVYNHTRRLSPSGGNDFYESGVMRPDLILADLIKIFHPDLLPDHDLVYYERLTGPAGRPAESPSPSQ